MAIATTLVSLILSQVSDLMSDELVRSKQSTARNGVLIARSDVPTDMRNITTAISQTNYGV